MKNIKLLLVVLTFSLVGFYSCTDNNPIENQVVTKNSMSLRSTLNEIKKVSGIGSRLASKSQDQALCFNFVYPINLAYNNGTVISVATFEGLLEVLTTENQNLYIEGIAFPFQVQQEGSITTINTEEEFNSLIDDCNFYSVDETIYVFDCYQAVYPFSIINQNNETVVIANENELYSLFASPNSNPENYIIDFVYPILLTQNGQTTTVNDIYELFDLLATCETSNDCICTLEYAPVCIQTASGIVEYSNFCLAECNGYTQNDIVQCGNSCGITNLVVTTGACNSDGSYALTIDFDYLNAPSTQFVVHSANGEIIGTYPLSSLPYTITNYPNVGVSADYLTVELGVNNDCQAIQQWAVPNCTTSTFNFGQLLGACFQIQYPVQVQYQGTLVTVTNDGELLQYYQPTVSQIPAFVYPIDVIFSNGAFLTFDGQQPFEIIINAECN